MKKLTAEKCRARINELEIQENIGALSIAGGYELQAVKIALPILEQQESEGATNEDKI